MGAVVLFLLMLCLAIVVAGSYALASAVAWLFGFDPLPWFFLSTLVLVPAATGYALTMLSRHIMVVSLSEVPPPEGANGGFVGGARPEEPHLSKNSKSFAQALALVMVMGGILAANLAAIVLIIELTEWLTSSEWPGLTVADGLALFGIVRDLPESESQRLIDLVLAIPLSISLFAVGILVCMAGLNLGDRSAGRGASARLPHRQ